MKVLKFKILKCIINKPATLRSLKSLQKSKVNKPEPRIETIELNYDSNPIVKIINTEGKFCYIFI